MLQRFWLITNALIQHVNKKTPNPKCKPKKQTPKVSGAVCLNTMFCYALFLMMKITYYCLRLHSAINDSYEKKLNRKTIIKESSKFTSATKYKFSLHACSFFIKMLYFMEIPRKPKVLLSHQLSYKE